jgi:beta-galactosidase
MPFFGITFYPDQWPEEYWEKAFTEIKQSGLDVVRFGEMMWDWVEPQEDNFTFEALDKAMSLCRKSGLKVILGTGIAQAPQWMIKKHRGLLPIAHDGMVHPEYGPRPNACRDNPIFRKYAEKLVRKLAKRYAKHPALFMWQLDNEPSYPPLDLTSNKDFCHCEATRKAFITWAKEKYKDINTLNKVWGTKFWVETFSNFEEINTPKAGFWDAGNPHIYLDWYRFKSDQLSTYLRWLKNIIKEYDQEHKIGTNSFTNIPNRATDHDVLAREMDWFGWDIYPKGTNNTDESLSQIADYWRSVCKSRDASFIVAELQAGPNVRWGNPVHVTGKDIKTWTKLLIDHGAEGIMYFNFRPPLFGSETGGFGLLKQDGTSTERMRAVKEVVNEVKAKTIAARTNTIAIYYSKSSEIQTFQEEGPQRAAPPGWISGRGPIGLLYGADSIAGAYRAIYPRQADFIFERHLDEGNMPYKVILLTNPYLLSLKQYTNLSAWMRAGGILISEARFGLKDEHAQLYQIPLIEKLFEDIEHEGAEIIDGQLKTSQLKAVAYGFRDVVKCSSGIIDTFEDNSPAIIKRDIGKGKILYAAFSLFSSFLKGENGKLIELIRSMVT